MRRSAIQLGFVFFFFLRWADCEHICSVLFCFCIWCSCVLTVRPLNCWCCIRATFHRDAPLWITTRVQLKTRKKTSFTRTFSYFVFAWLPWLSFSQSQSQVYGTHPEQSPAFSQHPEISSRIMLPNFKGFAPLRKHFTIIREFHLQFSADLAFWIYQTYQMSMFNIQIPC